MRMRPPIAQLLGKVPWEGFLLDGVSILLALVLWEPAVQALTPHLSWLFWLIAPLHILGVWAGLSFGHGEPPPSGGLWEKLRFFQVPATVLALGGFLWMFVPALTIEAQTGHFPRSFGLQFLLMLFGGILVFGTRLECDEPPPRLPAFLGVAAYLLYTELVFAACAETGAVSGGMAALALGMAYLPMRYCLAMRPPYSLWELFTAVLAFGLIVRDFFI